MNFKCIVITVFGVEKIFLVGNMMVLVKLRLLTNAEKCCDQILHGNSCIFLNCILILFIYVINLFYVKYCFNLDLKDYRTILQ